MRRLVVEEFFKYYTACCYDNIFSTGQKNRFYITALYNPVSINDTNFPYDYYNVILDCYLFCIELQKIKYSRAKSAATL